MEEENKKFEKWPLDKNPFLYDLEKIKENNSFPISCIPENGFLRKYLEYSCHMSDAPLPFGFFVGLSILATSSPNVFYQFGYQRKRLNMYMILTAPTAHYRKSTATGLGRYIISMTTPNKETSIIFPDDFTMEKILSIIAEQKVGSWFFDEWSGIMANMQKTYNAGIKQLLTSLWENGSYIRKIKTEEVVIQDAYLNICSSTTIDWLTSTILEEDVNGGFQNRLIYIFCKEKTRFWDIPPFKGNPCEEIILRDYLVEAQKNNNELVLSEDAEDKYRDFYGQFEENFDKKESNVKNLYVRLPIYCLKFACLYQINEDIKQTEISGKNMEMAIELIKWVWNCSFQEADEKFLVDPNYKKSRQILNYIIKKKCVSKTEIYRTAKIDTRSLESHLLTLTEEGRIRKEKIVAKNGSEMFLYYSIE